MSTDSSEAETMAPASEDQQSSAERLEAEIEATRGQLGETAAELAAKADVKKQAKRKVADTKVKASAKKDELKERATAQRAAATAKMGDVTPDSARAGVQQTAAQAQYLARGNPIQAAAIAAFAGGLVVGLILGRR